MIDKRGLTLLFIVCIAFIVPPAFGDESTLTITNFNIQVFGKAKANKADVMDTLAKTIARYDIVSINEIRDASGTAIVKLETAVDNLGTDYTVVIGPRLGRTSSKEQYTYMYKADSVELIGDPYTYQEPTGTDHIHREPFIAKFKSKAGAFDFVLITIHTDPDDATQEIDALVAVLNDAKTKYPDERDFIILGDLNADCTYYDEDRENPIPDTTWLIPDTLDTTVKGTVCSYDRIIITETTVEDYAGNAGVFRFDTEYGLTQEQAEKVSDHYPVYGEFWVGRDTD